MILGFKMYDSKGFKTYFVDKILSGVVPSHVFRPKIHTIRAGQRWSPGKPIQMATGVRTRYYNQFNKDYPQLQTCISVQEILIKNCFDDKNGVWIDGRLLTNTEVETLAKNDGFDTVTDFWEWFKYVDFKGQLIHWTNYKY